MRVLVQRVTASVLVDGAVASAIRPQSQRLVALVRYYGDDASIAQRMAEKLWQLRILDHERSASDIGAPITWSSASSPSAPTPSGPAPSMNGAAAAAAQPLVEAFAVRCGG